MTTKEHQDRHKMLHRSLDELFADYIQNHPEEREFTKMPLDNLLTWSHEQTLNPTPHSCDKINDES